MCISGEQRLPKDNDTSRSFSFLATLSRTRTPFTTDIDNMLAHINWPQISTMAKRSRPPIRSTWFWALLLVNWPGDSFDGHIWRVLAISVIAHKIAFMAVLKFGFCFRRCSTLALETGKRANRNSTCMCS